MTGGFIKEISGPPTLESMDETVRTGSRASRAEAGKAFMLNYAGLWPLSVLLLIAAGLSGIGQAADPYTLKIEAPSTVVSGSSVEVSLSIPTEAAGGTFQLRFATDSEAELVPVVRLPVDGKHFQRIQVKLKTPGIHRLEAWAADRFIAKSNPIRVTQNPPEFGVFWGELHAHTLGAHTTFGSYDHVIDRYYDDLNKAYIYAREVERLDFVAITNHFQDLGGLLERASDGSASPWELTQLAARKNNQPGRFVTFLAYEWQGTEGDHNIFYKYDNEEISPFNRLRFVFEDLAKLEALVIPHQVSIPTRWVFHDPVIQRNVEISNRGKNVEHTMALPGLTKGLELGFVGASDDHSSHPGINSITAALAKDLTREGIWEAISNRRIYATTGEKILLEVKVGGHWMGERYEASSTPRIDFHAEGTDVIREASIIRNGSEVHTVSGSSSALSFSFEDEALLSEGMPSNYYYVRVTQGTGEIVRQASQPEFVENSFYLEGAQWAWSSPVWVDFSKSMLEQWAAKHLPSDDVEFVAGIFWKLKGAYEAARVSTDENHASQAFSTFSDAVVADSTALLTFEGKNGKIYVGEDHNTLEQTPKWLPAGLIDVTPGSLSEAQSSLREQFSSTSLEALHTEATQRSFSEGVLGETILGHLDGAARYLDFAHHYFSSLLHLQVARNAWLAGAVSTDDLAKWLQNSENHLILARKNLDSWLKLWNRHGQDRIPFNFLRESHLKNDGPALIADAEGVLEKIRVIGSNLRLGMSVDLSHGLSGYGLSVARNEFERHGNGVRLITDQLLDVRIDHTYVGSLGQWTERDHHLFRQLLKRYGMLAKDNYSPRRTVDAFVRIVYQDVAPGDLFLEYEALGGDRVRTFGPVLNGDRALETYVFKVGEADFLSAGASEPHFSLGVSGSNIVIQSIEFYSPRTLKAPAERLENIRAKRDKSGDLTVRFDVTGDLDVNVGIWAPDGKFMQSLASGVHARGSYEYRLPAHTEGAYEMRIEAGFSGLRFLGTVVDSPPDVLSPKKNGEIKNDYPLEDLFGNRYLPLPRRTRALNTDLYYWVQKVDPQGEPIFTFSIPAKAKFLDDDPFYIVPGNRNWLSHDQLGNLYVSAGDQVWPDERNYVFSKEELTMWRADYEQVLIINSSPLQQGE